MSIARTARARLTRAAECVHTYPDGRKCRRIPKAGQKLCLGHQRLSRRLPAEQDAAFAQEMSAWVDRLEAMPLAPLLTVLEQSLAGVAPLIDRRTARRHRLAFARAVVAVAAATDRIQADLGAFRAQPAPKTAPPPQLRTLPPPPAPASLGESSAQPATRDELYALCERLLSDLSSYT